MIYVAAVLQENDMPITFRLLRCGNALTNRPHADDTRNDLAHNTREPT